MRLPSNHYVWLHYKLKKYAVCLLTWGDIYQSWKQRSYFSNFWHKRNTPDNKRVICDEMWPALRFWTEFQMYLKMFLIGVLKLWVNPIGYCMWKHYGFYGLEEKKEVKCRPSQPEWVFWKSLPPAPISSGWWYQCCTYTLNSECNISTNNLHTEHQMQQDQG